MTAPGVFQVLELEPLVGNPDPTFSETTSRETQSRETQSSPQNLADFLEPESLGVEPLVDVLGATVGPDMRAALGARPHDDEIEDGVEDAGRFVDGVRRVPWLWIGLTSSLSVTLGWVILTQTDLATGDVIASRDQEVARQQENERKMSAARVEQERRKYGTIRISSDPPGAEVWMVKHGAEVAFENLPRAHEYLFWVRAPGQHSQVRSIKGSEIDGTVTVDLDPLQNGLVVSEGAVRGNVHPRLAEDFDAQDAVSLRLRSPDKGVSFSLLVGYTPGAHLDDLDVSRVWEFIVTKTAHNSAEIVVKGRHWEEQGNALVFDEIVNLYPSNDTEDANSQSQSRADSAPDAASAPHRPKRRREKRRHGGRG